MKQIADIALPNRYAPSRQLVALTCSGQLYVSGYNSSNVRAWKAAADAGAPWNAVPSGVSWREVSHGPQGAYLLASDYRVLLMATGSMDVSGAITWTAPNYLLPFTLPPGFSIKHVGGPFVQGDIAGETCDAYKCTGDAKRVWRWDGAAYTHASGAPSSRTSGANPWGGIVDGSRFHGSPGAYGLLHTEASRMYVWYP